MLKPSALQRLVAAEFSSKHTLAWTRRRRSARHNHAFSAAECGGALG